MTRVCGARQWLQAEMRLIERRDLRDVADIEDDPRDRHRVHGSELRPVPLGQVSRTTTSW